MDPITRKFLTDVAAILVILVFTMVLFWRYPQPGILLAGGLALAVYVAADIVLLRKS